MSQRKFSETLGWANKRLPVKSDALLGISEAVVRVEITHELIHATQQENLMSNSDSFIPGGLPQHKLKWVTDYINSDLERDLSLQELAAIAQLSPYHFSRTFKQSTGISPHQYVIQQRVERAKQLLLQGKMCLSEIAIACGFSHQSHLNRHFKRITGVTPKTLLNS